MQKISDLLIKSGVKRTVALVVEVLSDCKVHTMRDIERKADLRQPEVSVAISILHEYLTISEKPSLNRGRPSKCVAMDKKAAAKFGADRSRKIDAEVDEMRKSIGAYRNIVSGW